MNILNRTPVVILVALLLALFVLRAVPTFNHDQILNGDATEYLENPLRVLHGEQPYQDFWLLFSPNVVYVPALIYTVVGVNTNSFILAHIAISMLAGLVAFFAGLLLFKDRSYAFVGAILFFFHGLLVHYGSFVENSFFALLLVSYLALMVRYIERPSRWLVLVAGLVLGLALMTRAYETIPAILAGLVVLALVQARWSERMRSGAVFLSGILAVLAGYILTFFSMRTLMLREIFIEALKHGTSRDLSYLGNLYELLAKVLHHGVGAIPDLLKNGTLYLFPLITVGCAIYLLARHTVANPVRSNIIFLATWGILEFPKAWVSPAISNLSFSYLPLFFCFLLLWQTMRKERWHHPILRYANYGIITILLLPFFAFPVKLVFAMQQKNYQIHTATGTFYTSDPALADAINQTVATVEAMTKADDYIFSTPALPAFYIFTNRRNPTHYDSLIDLQLRPSEEHERGICRDLLAKKTKVVIHLTATSDEGKAFAIGQPIIQKCITDHFKPLETFGDFVIYGAS